MTTEKVKKKSKTKEEKSEKRSRTKKPSLRDIDLLVSKNSGTKEVVAQISCLGLSATGKTRREAVWGVRAKLINYLNQLTKNNQKLGIIGKPKIEEEDDE